MHSYLWWEEQPAHIREILSRVPYAVLGNDDILHSSQRRYKLKKDTGDSIEHIISATGALVLQQVSKKRRPDLYLLLEIPLPRPLEGAVTNMMVCDEVKYVTGLDPCI